MNEDDVKALLAALVPAGTVVAFAGEAGTNVPPGWLLCNGDAYSRAVYDKLFRAIGTRHGNGDGLITFNVPDLRGRFVRGVDHGKGTDLGVGERRSVTGENYAGVGSVQNEELKSHTHPIPTNVGNAGQTVWHVAESGRPVGIVTGPSGGSETRPVNVALNWIIKY